MKNKSRYLFFTSILLPLLFASVSCKSGKEGQQEQAATYPMLELSLQDRVLSVSYTAVIEGKQDVEIRPQVSGFVTEVRVKEGAKVKKGQILFVIDTIPYAAAYYQAKATVATAEAQEATAKLNLEGSEELYASKVISDFELQTARNTYNSAAASLAQAKAQEVNAANNLSFAKVKSPVDGNAGMTSVRVGALVSSSMTEPLIRVSDNSQMYVYFSLPEKEVLRLTKEYGSLEKTVDSYQPVTLTLSDGTVYDHQGKIDVISGIVDKTTGTVRLRAVFDNKDGRLMSGGSGMVNIAYSRENCIVIPQEATYEIQDKIYAFKVIDGKAVATMIEVFGINDGKEYIVESGLSEGDVIISKGAGLLKDGTKVTGTPQKTTNGGN